MSNLIIRCPWGDSNNELTRHYHDQIWGKLTTNDQELFEFLTLEIFQAGLSWSTIINRQAAFKNAFANFDFQKVANFDSDDQIRLLNNADIIRNRLKISATINNAKIILQLQENYGSFNNYLNHFWPETIVNHPVSDAQVPPTSLAAEKLSKQFKKDGFKFIGPTIIYSFLQATGRINDHIETCAFKY